MSAPTARAEIQASLLLHGTQPNPYGASLKHDHDRTRWDYS
jgi:hypothetical protein